MNINTLQQITKFRGLTQSDIALAAQVSRQAVSQWLSHKQPAFVPIASNHLLSLSKSMGVSADVLLNEIADPDWWERETTNLLWDRLFEDLTTFLAALNRGDLRALARLVEVYGLFASAKIIGPRAWEEFSSVQIISSTQTQKRARAIMAHSKKPSLDLANNTLPKPLFFAITTLFSSVSKGVCLVGGTALAGFYAGHRRSDDIDLFTADEFAQKATIRACRALVDIGAKISGDRESRQHFHCLAELSGHRFTIDVVLDPHFHTHQNFQTQVADLCVATLEGLLAMKIATLVSRCGEKDLYDLIWLFKNYKRPHFSELVALGQTIDTGVSEESILISLSGTQLSEFACHFAEQMGASAPIVFEQIDTFKTKLIRDFSVYLKQKNDNFALKTVLDKMK